MNYTKSLTLFALGLMTTSAIEMSATEQLLQDLKSQNQQNEQVYRLRLDEMNKSLHGDRDLSEGNFLLLQEDDLDSDDITAYSATVRDDADNYKTLSQTESEQEENEKKMKKQLAQKKKKLAAMKAQKAKKEKAEKAAAAKKKKAAAKKKSAAKKAKESPISKKKEETPFPEDEGAMKSYSQAIAQQAEITEPDTPVAYEHQAPAEKTSNND